MKKNNKLALAIALAAGLGGARVMEATQPQQTETTQTKRTSFLGDGGKKKHNNLIRTNRSKKRLRTKNNA
jgi:hypothetical protein